MFGQFVINRLITGMLYASHTIAFAIVHNITHVFHIAAARIYVVAAYMFWLISAYLGLLLLFASIIAVVLTIGLRRAIVDTFYRPLKKHKASLNVAIIASISVMVVIVKLVDMLYGDKTVHSILQGRGRIETEHSHLCYQYMVVRNYIKQTNGLFAHIIGKNQCTDRFLICKSDNNLPFGRVKYALV